MSGGSAPILLSKRAALRALPPDLRLLRFLDEHGLGREKRRVASRRMRVLREKGLVDVHSSRGTTGRRRGGEAAAPESDAGASADAGVRRKGGVFEVPYWAVKKVASATDPQSIPTPWKGLNEVAFVGRSNAGKSSLLNALLGLERFPLVRSATSDRPGETRSVDFFRLGKGSKSKLILVDTPGYGFAFAKPETRDLTMATTLAYLRGRGKPLKRVCLLLDARHGFKTQDVQFLKDLHARGKDRGQQSPPSVQLVLTKCDLVPRMDLARRVGALKREAREVMPRESLLPTMLVSVKGGSAEEESSSPSGGGGKSRPGLRLLRAELASLAARSDAVAAPQQ
jgi:GTP-binding protein